MAQLTKILHGLKVTYLIESGKFKQVKIAKHLKYVTCGIPQVRPPLFLVYVNNLTNASRLLDPIMFPNDIFL